MVLVLWQSLRSSAPVRSSHTDSGSIRTEVGAEGPSGNPERRAGNTLADHDAPVVATRAGAEARARRVFGRVIDSSGHPVAGVDILAAEPVFAPGLEVVLAFGIRRNEPGFAPARPVRTTSDREGAFALEVPARERVQLALHRDGFADQQRVARFTEVPWEEKALALGDLVIEPAVELPIRVVDESGRAVPDAEVLRRGVSEVDEGFRLDWNELVLAGGASDGVVRLDALASGRTELEVRAPGYVSVRREVLADRLVLEEWRVVLPSAAPIAGRVLDAPGGESLEVGFWEPGTRETRHVRCRPDGSFTIDGLAPGAPEVRLYATRVIRNPDGALDAPAYARETITPSVPARPGERDVVLRVPAPCRYRLTVEDSETGARLSDVRFGGWESADSPNHEVAVLEGKPEGPGVYVLSRLLTRARKSRAIAVAHDGYESVAVGGLLFVPGEVQDLGVVGLRPVPPTLLRVTDVRESTVGGLEIVVYAGLGTRDTAPFVGGWPERTVIVGELQRVTTAADGTASVYLTRHQTHSFWSEGEGGSLQCSLVVEDAPPRELDLRLEPLATITVRCLDARTREPLVGESIRHEFVEAPELTLSPGGTTDDEGRLDFEGLTPGRHRFWSDGFASGASSETVSLAAGVSMEVTLLLPTFVALHGRITERGRPVEGARVEVRGRSGLTDRDGMWGLDVEEPGEAELRIVSPDGSAWVETVRLVLPETRFDVDLSSRTVRGVVSGVDAPLSGATVRLVQRRPDGRYDDTRHRTTSGAEGDFRLGPFLPREELYLVAECPGYQVERLGPLERAEDGGELVLAPRLSPAATLEVIVEGDPPRLLGWRVHARWNGASGREPDDLEALAELVAGGEPSGARLFRFDRLSPGPWRIEVRHFDWLEDQVAVELTAGENAPLRMRP